MADTAPLQTEKDRIVQVLIEHGNGNYQNSREGWVMCFCGERLRLPGGFDPHGYPLVEDEEERVRAAHVADMLLAIPPGGES